MRQDKLAVEEGFYRRCAELLGCAHPYRPFPYDRRTRWNNRAPGNGRFPGRGVVRLFGPGLIHVALTAPAKVNRTFASPDAALGFLEALCGEGR